MKMNDDPTRTSCKSATMSMRVRTTAGWFTHRTTCKVLKRQGFRVTDFVSGAVLMNKESVVDLHTVMNQTTPNFCKFLPASPGQDLCPHASISPVSTEDYFNGIRPNLTRTGLTVSAWKSKGAVSRD